MCVLIVHLHAREDAPLVVLANRDEAYDRPFAPPARWPGDARIVAPRDLRAGGTWFGVASSGLVAAITNRVTRAPRLGLRSRGLLVADVLGRRDAQDAARWLDDHLERTEYDLFNLLVADRAGAFLVRNLGCSVERVALAPGTHVLTNLHELDEPPVPPAALPRAGEPLDALLARLESVAADRETPLPGDHRICKVGRTRGTVCSAVLALPSDPASPPRLRFANGPPHVTPFEDVPTPVMVG
jgi:uncharacterized protein with NRDE domain